jgi:hypothetical protein
MEMGFLDKKTKAKKQERLLNPIAITDFSPLLYGHG